jgi:hypothetical protein
VQEAHYLGPGRHVLAHSSTLVELNTGILRARQAQGNGDRDKGAATEADRLGDLQHSRGDLAGTEVWRRTKVAVGELRR